jgi:hypothetical protein
MEVYKKLVVAAGNYTVNGQEKTRWISIGRLLKSPKGVKLKIDTIPLEWNGWAELVDPDQEEKARPAVKAKAAPVDDMPF